jgi:hypothetical protein
MLEPDDGKLSSPVLRGLAPSNGGRPLGCTSRCTTRCRHQSRRQPSRPGGKGKEAASEGTIATRFVVERRTKVDEARTRFDPGGLADDDIHRLVRVTA